MENNHYSRPDYFLQYSQIKKRLLALTADFCKWDRDTFDTAISVAERYHAGQIRSEVDDEGVGYVIHCLRVALWLAQHGILDKTILSAAILHDTLEDTKLPKAELGRLLGHKILDLVLTVTRPRKRNETETEKIKNKTRYFTKILQGSLATRQLKTADCLDNMRSWIVLARRKPAYYKFPRWINEAKKLYIPMAEVVFPDIAREMKTILIALVSLRQSIKK